VRYSEGSLHPTVSHTPVPHPNGTLPMTRVKINVKNFISIAKIEAYRIQAFFFAKQLLTIGFHRCSTGIFTSSGVMFFRSDGNYQ
jgi:hypothetical protein